MKKETDTIIIHVGTNDAKFKMSRQILKHLLRLKKFILNTIPTFKMIISKSTVPW